MRRILPLIVAGLVLCSPARAELYEIHLDYTQAPFDHAITHQAVRDAAVVLAAVSGHEFEVVDSHTQRVTATRCTLSFVSGFDLELGNIGFSRAKPCEAMVRVGIEGVRNPRELYCVALHEMWHWLLPRGWHSDDPGSVMYETKSGACLVTADLVKATVGGPARLADR